RWSSSPRHLQLRPRLRKMPKSLSKVSLSNGRPNLPLHINPNRLHLKKPQSTIPAYQTPNDRRHPRY
ncbi:hypothetical protein C0993_005835, partial [Termitomyces sp. T159_Od127]